VKTEPKDYRREIEKFTLFDVDWNRGRSFAPSLDSLESIRPYELIAQDKVKAFLRTPYDQRDENDRDYLSRFDMLMAAEQALSSVLRWHESARQTEQRKGDAWDEVQASLRKMLLDDVLLEQMKVLAAERDWDKVLALTRRLAATYANTAERERIFRPVAGMIQDALKDATAGEEQKQQVRKRLQELESEYPDNPAFKPLREMLTKQAQSLLDQAKELIKDKKDTAKVQEAMKRVHEAEETWPQLPELRTFKLELSSEHPVLRVGVRGRLPQYFSPGWACTDSELRAVEMMFESLVQLVPDQAGGLEYRQGLAEYRPRVVALGRQFELPHNTLWSDGHTVVNASDIDFTLKLLQQEGVSVGRSREWGKLLDTVVSKSSPTQLTIRLKQGFLDPLALMTFKILPRDRKDLEAVNTEAFARKPVSSGPFRLDAERHSDENNRECVFFMANPSYGLRPTKRLLPHIQEIRFYAYNDAVAELASGKLDLVLDLNAKEAEELKKRSEELKIEVPKPSPNVPNRRIYFLAINNQHIKDVHVRQTLAKAINREALLDTYFRGALKEQIHKPLNGPFPVGSWASNPSLVNRQNKKNPLDMFDEARARDMSRELSFKSVAGSGGKWELKYPDGDPILAEAMKALCAQIKDLTGMTFEPTPLEPSKLRDAVEQTQSYDLAYYHYDFPDETYWLAPLLSPSPRAVGGEDNIFRFNNDKLPILLGEATKYRDFAQVQKHAWVLHEWLNSEMPFIPLWQFDPLAAYSRAVEPAGWEPLLLFGNIAEWRLQRK
jgi:ABC-type transport system substrate-binding protein